jgi:hypothetical protein
MSRHLSKTSSGLGTNTTAGKAVDNSEFGKIKQRWVEQELHRFSHDYQPEIRKKIERLELGAMYFMGRSGEADIYLLENATMIKGKRKNDGYEFSVLVKFWYKWDKRWGPIPNRLKGYEYEMSLEEFAKDTSHTKLAKHPLELFAEAEKALATGDISMYEMDAETKVKDAGPDTQLLHIGSKESLEIIHRELEARRDHAISIRKTMEVIIEMRKRELEVVRDKMYAAIKVFEKKIAKIFRVITTIELYLGISEEIAQIQEGPAAKETDPVSIRQGLMFMDEEVGDPWDDGQGLDWNTKGIAAFDDWLTRNNNDKKVLPEAKGIAAFKTRRYEKKRDHLEGQQRAMLADMDDQTFLLIRNGDNLYRLITDKISFIPRLFPRRDELQRLLEYWKLADSIEAKREGEPAYMRTEENRRKDSPFRDFRHDGSKTSDAKEYAEDNVFFYKMRLTLFQGLLDRTTILHPIPEPIKMFDPQFQEKGLVRLIYDDELTLPSGKLSFWAWMAKLNSGITYGSRIILADNWGFKESFGHDNMSEAGLEYARKTKGNRFDDRFGDGSGWSHLPPNPNNGLYYVKKGVKWVNEPVWIENPDFDPTKPETPSKKRFHPDDEQNNDRWNKKGWEKVDLTMSYTDQKKWFGKIVSKSTFDHHRTHDHDGELLTDDKKYGDVKVDWNPRELHLCMITSRRKEKSFKYVNRDVKHEFLCIRYNPKDTVGEHSMFRTWDSPEPEERKNNVSWKIYTDDAFIINYDQIIVEDIEFYVNSRVDRASYKHMMPLLWEVRKQLLEEKKSEVDFKKLVQGEVFKLSGTMPTDEKVDSEVEKWKTNLKWKRAIHHNDSKALRMIVQRICKQLKE